MTVDWGQYLSELHRGKDLAYGDAWCRRGESSGIFPNIARKYDRWIRIRDLPDGATRGVEPLDDTLADLLIYAVKYVLWLIERHPEIAIGLSDRVLANQSVADLLSNITRTAIIENPATAIVESFERLEAIFASASVDQTAPIDRAEITWSLALGAWGELHDLPVPNEREKSPGSTPTLELISPGVTDDLRKQLLAAFAEAPGHILLLGLTPAAIELRAQLGALGLGGWLLGIVQPEATSDDALGLLDWSQIRRNSVDIVVVTSDEGKEELERRDKPAWRKE